MLAVLQAFAFGKQFALGFRPFVTPPQRVALSWDMFAVQIERCSLSWSVPVDTPRKRISALHDLAAPVEWDVVYNSYALYRLAGAYACNQRSSSDAPRSFALFCWLGRHATLHEHHDCR